MAPPFGHIMHYEFGILSWPTNRNHIEGTFAFSININWREKCLWCCYGQSSVFIVYKSSLIAATLSIILRELFPETQDFCGSLWVAWRYYNYFRRKRNFPAHVHDTLFIYSARDRQTVGINFVGAYGICSCCYFSAWSTCNVCHCRTKLDCVLVPNVKETHTTVKFWISSVWHEGLLDINLFL